MIAAVAAALHAIGSALAAFLRLLEQHRQKEAGRTEARLDAAQRAAREAQERRQIEDDVSRMGDADVADELRDRWTRRR